METPHIDITKNATWLRSFSLTDNLGRPFGNSNWDLSFALLDSRDPNVVLLAVDKASGRCWWDGQNTVMVSLPDEVTNALQVPQARFYLKVISNDPVIDPTGYGRIVCNGVLNINPAAPAPH